MGLVGLVVPAVLLVLSLPWDVAVHQRLVLSGPRQRWTKFCMFQLWLTGSAMTLGLQRTAVVSLKGPGGHRPAITWVERFKRHGMPPAMYMNDLRVARVAGW